MDHFLRLGKTAEAFLENRTPVFPNSGSISPSRKFNLSLRLAAARQTECDLKGVPGPGEINLEAN